MFYRFNQVFGFEWFRAAMALVPAFDAVYKNKQYGEAACRWLLAIYDIRSPYQSINDEDERIIAVNKHYFQKKRIEWQDDKIILEAITAFHELFWDADLVQLSVYDKQIKAETERMSKYTTAVEISTSGRALKELNELREVVINNIIGRQKRGEFEDLKLKGGRRLSHLVKWQEEQKELMTGASIR